MLKKHKKHIDQDIDQLFEELMFTSKITIESLGQSKPIEMVVSDYILVARTTTGEIVTGNGSVPFLSRAAVRVMNQALKADQDSIDNADDEDTDGCGDCDMRSKCPAAKHSK